MSRQNAPLPTSDQEDRAVTWLSPGKKPPRDFLELLLPNKPDRLLFLFKHLKTTAHVTDGRAGAQEVFVHRGGSAPPGAVGSVWRHLVSIGWVPAAPGIPWVEARDAT